MHHKKTMWARVMPSALEVMIIKSDLEVTIIKFLQPTIIMMLIISVYLLVQLLVSSCEGFSLQWVSQFLWPSSQFMIFQSYEFKVCFFAIVSWYQASLPSGHLHPGNIAIGATCCSIGRLSMKRCNFFLLFPKWQASLQHRSHRNMFFLYFF